MFRYTLLPLALSSLLWGCAEVPRPLTPTPSLPVSSTVAPTPPSSILMSTTTRDADAIDAATAAVTPEIQQDKDGATFAAYRVDKVIRKIVVDRNSSSEVSTTRYYLTPQRVPFYIKASGAAFKRAPTTGYLTTVTTLDAQYYIRSNALFAATPDGALVAVNADRSRALHADAEAAIARYSQYDPAYKLVVMDTGGSTIQCAGGPFVERVTSKTDTVRLDVSTCEAGRSVHRTFAFDETGTLTEASKQVSPAVDAGNNDAYTTKAYAREPDGRLVLVGGRGITATPDEERALIAEAHGYLDQLARPDSSVPSSMP